MIKAIQALAWVSLLTGFLILLHQYVSYGVWFSLSDVHHETLAVAFGSLGLGILVGLVGRTTKP